MSVAAKVIWTFSSYVIVRYYYLHRLIFLQWNEGAVVFHLPNHLGAEYPLLSALMERINVVNFPKRQIIRKSFRKYFSIYIYTWVSLMFQEFIIQKTKAQNKKSVWFKRKLETLQLCHLIPLFLNSLVWGRSASMSLTSEGFQLLKHC